MDDPDWAWPAWKFGMRQDDISTTLHDRYNTLTYTLQDPEAFHHDVYEISRDADTAEEFHRMLADRQQQRLRELNESLETLAVEIIANPKLMGSAQWQHALQLFRTKSFDSIVRYFASYLPGDYLDRHDTQSMSSCPSSEADSVDTASTKASSADAPCSLYFDDDVTNGPVMAVECCAAAHDAIHDDASPLEGSLLPSQQSDAVSPKSSPSDAESRSCYSTNPPSRSMSFSGSESGHVPELMRGRFDGHDDDETSQSSDYDTAATSVCGSAETLCDCAASNAMTQPCSPLHFEDDDDFPAAQYPDGEVDCFDKPILSNDSLESDTPTPRQETVAAASYMEYKSVVGVRREPVPRFHLAHRATAEAVREVRRSPEEALSRIQKPPQDGLRKRPKGRRRAR